MNAQWYLSNEGQTFGPYTGEQLQQFAQEGRIVGSSLLWAEGMTEWLPASQIPGVLPQAVAVAPAPAWAPPGARAAGSNALATSPYQQSSLVAAAASTDAPYPHISVKAASFALWMWSFVGAFLLWIIGAVALAASTASGPESVNAGAGIFGILLFVGILVLLLSYVFFYINLYRAWKCLQFGAPSTSPGKAIGLLFIPFFNLYWMFVSILGLAKDWNRIVSSYEDLHNAPRLSETTFLIFCIGSIVFAPLAMIVMFPMMSQLCRGINFFAYRKNLTNTTAGFGGIKFG